MVGVKKEYYVRASAARNFSRWHRQGEPASRVAAALKRAGNHFLQELDTDMDVLKLIALNPVLGAESRVLPPADEHPRIDVWTPLSDVAARSR